jgi:hypothetical protein
MHSEVTTAKVARRGRENESMGYLGFPLNWQLLLKRLLAAALYLLISFTVLCLVYDIRDRMRWSRHSLAQILPQYLLTSFAVTCIVTVFIPLLTWWCNRLVIWTSVIIRTVITFVVLYFLSGAIGSSHQLINNPPTSHISDFFSDLEFLIFQFEYAPIVSMLAGLYYWWIGRRAAVSPSSPTRYATRGRAREP